MKKISIIFVFVLICFLFLFSSCDLECRHDNLRENTVAPSCTESGHTEYTCLDCGYTYIDKIIDPVGHSFENNILSADCTNDGYTEYTCSCGYSYKSDIVSAYGHKYVDTITQADCINGGYTTHKCSVCSYTYISGHTSPNGHRFIQTVIDSTCTEQGYTSYQCTDCDYFYKTKYTAPIEHQFTQTVTYPTCTDMGYTTLKCGNCGYSYVSDYTDPKGHTYIKSTVSLVSCTTEGEEKYTCDCGNTYSVISPPTGHDFAKTVTMPTLSDMGYSEYKCKNGGCDFKYTGDLRFYSDILKNAYAQNSEVLAKGIDISHHQYNKDANGYISLDWDAIKAAGVEYVIIRAGEASIGLDPTFEKSYTEAREAGLDIGAYFYTMAQSVEEIRREAYLLLSALEGKQFEYPIYLDLEDDSLRNIDPAVLNEMCVEFFTILQRSGYYTGLYVNNEWLYNVIDTESALERFEIWYARYPVIADGDDYVWSVEENGQHLGMWQYCDDGIIDGIDTKFDFNFAYKDYPTLIKEGGFNGYESNVIFPDIGSSFVWVVHSGDIKIRSKKDYFTSDEYDPEADIIGYAKSGDRFEVFEATDQYTAISYNGNVAYITANLNYVSFNGLLIAKK